MLFLFLLFSPSLSLPSLSLSHMQLASKAGYLVKMGAKVKVQSK